MITADGSCGEPVTLPGRPMRGWTEGLKVCFILHRPAQGLAGEGVAGRDNRPGRPARRAAARAEGRGSGEPRQQRRGLGPELSDEWREEPARGG